MVNLIKNAPKSKDGLVLDETKKKEGTEIKPPEKEEPKLPKADIKRYRDPEGLTVTKLELGYWLVKNKEIFRKMLYGFLISVSVITWSIFFYNFGLYVIKGMKEDQRLLHALIRIGNINHEITLAQAAQPLNIGAVQYIKIDQNKYDLAVQIENPNEKHWGELKYHFVSQGREFGHGENFILPKEKKFIVVLNQEIISPSDLFFRIDREGWRRVTAHNFPEWDDYAAEHLDFDITRIQFTPARVSSLSEKVNLNELSFLARNNSAYNYYEIDFVVLLYGRRDDLVGVNKYTLREFFSEQEREVKITWPGFISAVTDVNIQPEVNITDPEIYIPFEGEVVDF